MTPTELADVIDYCEDRWPGTRNYRAWDRAAYDFIAIPADAVREAAQNHYRAGERTAPTLSQLRAEGARLAAGKGLIDPNTSNCDTLGEHGNWAIDIADDGTRESTCLRCGATRRGDTKTMLTVGERAALTDRYGAPAPPDEIADRISP